MTSRTDIRPRWGTQEDAADHLGVTTRTIRRLIAEGRISAYRLGKRAIRIDLNELDDILTRIPAVDAS